MALGGSGDVEERQMVGFAKHLLCSGLFVGALASRAGAIEGNYLFDVLKQPPYRAAFDALIARQNLPGWIGVFARTGNGVAVPATYAMIQGTRYQLNHVCKPHDCAGNELEIMFAPNGAQAWGAVIDGGKPVRFLGDPNPAQAKALSAAMRE